MAALVQSFPQQSPSTTVTMLQTRPTSSSAGHYQQSGQSPQRSSQMPRTVYSGGNNMGSYRGQSTMAAVAPYAFTTTPSLAGNSNPLRQHPVPQLRQENRSISNPQVPTFQHGNVSSAQPWQRAVTNLPAVDASDAFQKDDVSGSSQRGNMASQKSASTSDLSKPSPDRYRRTQRRADNTSPALMPALTSGGSAMPSGSGMATVGHLYKGPSPAHSPQFETPPVLTKDDSVLNRQYASDQAKRYRRRSIASIGADDEITQPAAPPMQQQQQQAAPPQPRTYASVVSSPYTPVKSEPRPFVQPVRPSSSHGRNASDESLASSRSNSRPASKREGGALPSAGNPSTVNGFSASTNNRNEAKVPSVPSRGSSDQTKRLANPSPLSRPMAIGTENAVSKQSFASVVAGRPMTADQPVASPPVAKVPESPAAQQLAALNKKDAKKEGKPSRLRRAFSFGSSAELRKASAENSHTNNVTERARLRKEQYATEEEAREAAIVQQQEASGLGEGIYSGQGNFFTGSTDNLSISSTASSASIMLRKMGKGVKKGTRSFVGLFRPKSIVGVPAADSAVPEPSMAQVSMVTVEAERERVNVNLDPHDQPGGGTGFPKLERNSIDASSLQTGEPSLTASDKSVDSARPRRSIVGGEKERAEVLAAVKKGILKRHGTESPNSSPQNRPVDTKTTDFALPQIPRFSDSPHSSAPSTPVDDQNLRGHRRTDSVTIEGEDYFMTVARFGGAESKSLPGTPRSVASRNITFSPRIQFHDTWPSGEYDRRGEIATCNRLTPTLAQAIKEELNTFKMEMEVHESSKVYTHFF